LQDPEEYEDNSNVTYNNRDSNNQTSI